MLVGIYDLLALSMFAFAPALPLAAQPQVAGYYPS